MALSPTDRSIPMTDQLLDGVDAAVTGRPTDYYLLEDLLADEDRAVRDKVRAFTDAEIIPIINDYWERAVPVRAGAQAAELGSSDSTIEGYGCPGLSRLAAGLVAAEVARGDGSVNTFLGVHSGLAMGSIAMLGSEEQKQRWLPPMARLDAVGAFALTEPATARTRSRWRPAPGATARRTCSTAEALDRQRLVRRRRHRVGARPGLAGQGIRRGEGTAGPPRRLRDELITGKVGKRAVWQPDVRLAGVRVPRRTGSRAPTRSRTSTPSSPPPAAAPRGSAWGTRSPLRGRGGLRRRAAQFGSRSRASSWCRARWPGCSPRHRHAARLLPGGAAAGSRAG